MLPGWAGGGKRDVAAWCTRVHIPLQVSCLLSCLLPVCGALVKHHWSDSFIHPPSSIPPWPSFWCLLLTFLRSLHCESIFRKPESPRTRVGKAVVGGRPLGKLGPLPGGSSVWRADGAEAAP